MAHRHFPRQRNMQSKSRYKFFKNPENCKWLKLRKIVYLWRCFSLARKLLMGCFRGPLNYILDVCFIKTFNDKIGANFGTQRVGSKWHLDIYNLTKSHQKNVLQMSLDFLWIYKKRWGISDKLIDCSWS